MELLTKAPRGTQDVLPAKSHENRFVESSLLDIALNYGFKEIRTPVFEHTELFTRSVGDTTDVVQKEMYTFTDKGDRSITLRPEGTAGAARSFLEHGLFNEPLPQKVCYLTSCYRYEKPQAGRLREFHQFGVECFGTDSPAADAEVIALANEIFAFFGVDDIRLEINSIGCPDCRKNYYEALIAYFTENKASLCPTCLERLEKNPMRILDCKNPSCREVSAGAPVVIDYLCSECQEHFEKVKDYLDAMMISYEVNPRIVRGLDYYTKTVFEFVCTTIGAQGTVCGGGRYDGLIEQLGGSHVPSLGFGLGIERFMLMLESKGIELPEAPTCDIYIAPIGHRAELECMRIVQALRQNGTGAQTDVAGRSVKAQMKYANKIGAKYTALIGDDDLNSGVIKIKNMETGETTEMKLDSFDDDFMEFMLQKSAEKLSSALSDPDDLDEAQIKSILGKMF